MSLRRPSAPSIIVIFWNCCLNNRSNLSFKHSFNKCWLSKQVPEGVEMCDAAGEIEACVDNGIVFIIGVKNEVVSWFIHFTISLEVGVALAISLAEQILWNAHIFVPEELLHSEIDGDPLFTSGISFSATL